MQEVAGTARGQLGWVDHDINLAVNTRASLYVEVMPSGTAIMNTRGPCGRPPTQCNDNQRSRRNDQRKQSYDALHEPYQLS